MPQADGSRHSIGYVPEVTFGVTPANPVFKALRHNSSTLNLNKANFQSNELRSDRMIADFRHGTKAGEGNVVGELSDESYDDWLEAALGGTWAADVLKAGTVRRSFTVERRFGDIDSFLRYKGVQADTLQLSFTTGAVVGITLGLWARDMDAPAAAIIAGATYPAAPTSAPMDALTGEVLEGGAPIAVASEVTLNLANNLNPRYVIGAATSLEPSIGRSNLTGTLSAYFESGALYNKFLQEASSSLVVTAQAEGRLYRFTVPKLKYTGGDVPVAGEGPVSISMPFQGLLDPVTGTSFQIEREDV